MALRQYFSKGLHLHLGGHQSFKPSIHKIYYCPCFCHAFFINVTFIPPTHIAVVKVDIQFLTWLTLTNTTGAILLDNHFLGFIIKLTLTVFDATPSRRRMTISERLFYSRLKLWVLLFCWYLSQCQVLDAIFLITPFPSSNCTLMIRFTCNLKLQLSGHFPHTGTQYLSKAFNDFIHNFVDKTSIH